MAVRRGGGGLIRGGEHSIMGTSSHAINGAE